MKRREKRLNRKRQFLKRPKKLLPDYHCSNHTLIRLLQFLHLPPPARNSNNFVLRLSQKENHLFFCRLFPRKLVKIIFSARFSLKRRLPVFIQCLLNKKSKRFARFDVTKKGQVDVIFSDALPFRYLR